MTRVVFISLLAFSLACWGLAALIVVDMYRTWFA